MTVSCEHLYSLFCCACIIFLPYVPTHFSLIHYQIFHLFSEQELSFFPYYCMLCENQINLLLIIPLKPIISGTVYPHLSLSSTSPPPPPPSLISPSLPLPPCPAPSFELLSALVNFSCHICSTI